MIEIPIDAELGNQEFEVSLAGDVFRLNFSFNRRMDRWVMDIKDAEGNAIILGINLVLGIDLIARFVMNEKPKGQLFLLNSKDPFVEATESTLGTDVRLYFLEN